MKRIKIKPQQPYLAKRWKSERTCSIVLVDGVHRLVMPDGTLVPNVVCTTVREQANEGATAIVELNVNLDLEDTSI